nr:expressed conserved protein [Hymenolepis microstoma]
MTSASPRIYQITEYRDGYLYSTYFQVPDTDSSSSREDSSDDERRLVLLPLASYYETQEVHGKKKEQKRSKKQSRYSEKSLVPQTFCLNDKKTQYSPSLAPCPSYPKSQGHSSFHEELNDVRKYGLVTQQPKPPTLLIPLKIKFADSDYESLSTIFPMQHKMRPAHSTGSFSGPKPRKSARGISLEKKHSNIKTKNRSGSMSSSNMNVSQSGMGHSECNTAYFIRLQDIEAVVNSSASNDSRSIKRSKSRHLVAELRS